MFRTKMFRSKMFILKMFRSKILDQKCLDQIYSPIPGQKLRNVGYGGEKGGGSWFYSGIELYTNTGTFGT